MLDEDEVKEYEDWKERKLKSSVDLSVSAFNIEQEAAALAWEHGFKASVNGQTIESNPHRRPGMKGWKKPDPVSETGTQRQLQSFNDGEPDSTTVLRPKNLES